jgi:hypothetical protein
MQTLGSAIGRIGWAALCGGLLCALSLSAAAAPERASEAEELADGTAVVGSVVSVSGAAYAQAPGQERRILSCGDPIFEGDRLMTQERSALGVVSGDYYARLNQSTQLTFASTERGAPQVDLEAGHVRLFDALGQAPVEAEISAPGLVPTRVGSDTEVMVFAEKTGLVSIVCPFEGSLNVGRGADPGRTTAVEAGSCVVSKPGEALFGADATHPRLAVLRQDACETVTALPVGTGFFSPAQVALGPGILGGPPAASPATGLLMGSPIESCSVGITCLPPRQPTEFPDMPPPLPSLPSLPPPS